MLSTRAVFITLGVFVAMALVGMRGASLFETRARMLQAAETQAGVAAGFGAEYVARTYDLADRMAEDVRRRLIGGQLLADPTALHDYLAAQTEATSLADAITVYGPEGRPLVSSADLHRVRTAAADSWFAALRDDGEESDITPLALDQATGEASFSYARRLTDLNGRFAGAVRVSIRPVSLKPTRERGPAEPRPAIWTTSGRFVSSTILDFAPDGRARTPLTPPAVTSGAGRGLTATDDQILAFAKAPGWPLVATVEVDKARILAAWRQDVLRSSALLLVLLFGVGALVAVGAAIAGREETARRELEATTGALKGAVADRELLIKEVHHRVRNSLHLTAGVLHLQARQFEDVEVRAAFDNTQRRLDSIAMVHEALYRGVDLAEIDLADYLRRLAGDVAHANGASERGILVEVEAEPVMLAPEKATPVGLIVSEVMTNAFKHAFPEGGAGRILVRLASLPSGEVEVSISDNGRGFDGEAPSRGLGSRLIRTLADQLRARHSAISDRGALFRMVFPRA